MNRQGTDLNRVEWGQLLAAWAALLAVALLAAGCSVPEEGKPDPLQNTRKLVREGHLSLYENGAFTVPFTELKLIPPGPTQEELMFELALPSARDAFILNVAEAKEAMAVVSDGTRYSYALAQTVHRNTGDIVAAIRSHARPKAKLVAYKSYLKANGIRGTGLIQSKRAESVLKRWGGAIERSSDRSGDAASDRGAAWVEASPALADAILLASGKLSEDVGAGMDETAREWRRSITRQGDDLVIAGSSRLGTSMQTVPERIGEAGASAAGTQARVEAAGRELSAEGRASGNARTERGMALAGSSVGVGREIYDSAAKTADDVTERMSAEGRQLNEVADQQGSALARRSSLAGSDRVRRSEAQAERIYREGMDRADSRFEKASSAFVIGYATVPEKVSGHMAAIQPSRTLEETSELTQEHGRRRQERSDEFAWLVTDAIEGYSGRVSAKFEQAGKVFDETLESGGVSLATLKAMRWVVEGLLWDGAAEPAGRIGGGMLGYLAVNGVAYPALVTYEGGRATAHIAAQVTVGTAKSGWEIVAPTGEAALAGLMGMANVTAAAGGSAATTTVGAVAGHGQALAGRTAGFVIRAGGTAADVGLRYVAVPLTHAGLRIGGAAAGIGAGSAVLVAGGAQAMAGGLESGATQATGATMEHVGAPAAGLAVQTGGVATGVAEGVYDEVSGATLVATGGVLKGAALLTETTIKYGATPATQAALGAGGAVGATAGAGGKAVAGGSVYLWGRMVEGSGWVAGNLLEHAAAPVTKAGIVAVGEIGGGATQTSGELGEFATLAAGDAVAGTVWLFGNSIAGGVLVGGTSASAAYGGTVGLYELASSMVVPVGHLGGAGITLSYKTIGHLAAHSVLGVADASYLVLSMEGPRWVLYAVKGELGDGSELKPGTVMDLKAMQANGEVFYNVPVSEEEMRDVVRSVVEDMEPAGVPEPPAQGQP